jgi:Ca2+/Na+ antiporter
LSQGVALAILAWLQTLPEFAVEAVIAWEAGSDIERGHLAIANLTGAIRLLLGLGWPMIYFTFAFFGRTRHARRFPRIQLEREHATEVVGLIPPLLYFIVIVLKGTITWIDALVLLGLYFAYLVRCCPLHDAEKPSRRRECPSGRTARRRGARRRQSAGCSPRAGCCCMPRRTRSSSRCSPSRRCSG